MTDQKTPKPIQEFEAALREAAGLGPETGDFRTFKGPADKLVDIVQRDPENRGTYLQLILPLLGEDYEGSWEIVPYLQYRLRWPELREFAKARLRENDLCKRYRLYELVLESETKQWEATELPSFLGTNEHARPIATK